MPLQFPVSDRSCPVRTRGYKRRALHFLRPRFRTTEAAVFVACSTQCFASYPLERALRVIGELEFGKVDVALHEQGSHLRPTEVVRDVAGAAQQIRIGPS